MAAHHSAGHVELHHARGHNVDPSLLVRQVGSTKLTYLLRAKDDLAGMLAEHGDRMESGAADEQKPAKEGTVEAGVAPTPIPSSAGTASARAAAVGSACTCRRFSKCSVWSSWSTSPAATGCVRFSPDLPLASAPAHLSPNDDNVILSPHGDTPDPCGRSTR